MYMGLSRSSSKKKCSGRQVSVSMENVIPEETSTGQTGARFGSGRLLDLKLGGSRAHSTDGVASSSAVFSVRSLFLCYYVPVSVADFL